MPKDEEVIEKLKKIEEELENINLSDCKAWGSLHKDLGLALEGASESVIQTGSPFELCLRGLRCLAGGDTQGKAGNILVALADVLSGAIKAFEKGETGGGGQAKGVDVLASLPSGDSAEGNGKLIEKINDIASLLIQTDPGDISSVGILHESILSFSKQNGLPDALKTLLENGAEALGEIIKGESDGAEATLKMLGEGLESAIQDAEGFGKTETTPHSSSAYQASPKEAESVTEEKSNYMPDDSDPDIIVEFVTEGIELIANAEEALLALETNPDDKDAVGMVFRAFHTVKGTSAFLNLGLVSEMGHFAESLLSRVRDGEIRYSGGYADLALKALDMLKELIQRVKLALDSGVLTKPDGYDALLEILKNPEAAGFSEEASLDTGIAPVPRLGDILVAEGKAQREDVEKAAASGGKRQIAGKLVEMGVAPLPEIAQALRTQQQMKSAKGAEDSSVRVSTSRLDRLVDMVGELVIAYSMVAQDDVVATSLNRELNKKVSHAGKIIRELQDLSMSMRMVPLKSTFNKMTRLVRDLSRKVGKNVNLVTEGEDTEIDRNMVDIINDPLVHMVRNAVDHGIESPEDRRKAQKSEQGTIRLCAYHSAGNVVVEIRDDGKGLDREAILEKARKQGLISEGFTPSERDIFNLIFEPGFSTAKVVTEVSGRGVGMDVVKKNIEKLRGQVEILSTQGQGSVFRISLPLTLAIIDGMVVRVGSERYVIPTGSIVRAVKPAREDFFTVANRGEMVSLNEELLPLFRLADIFSISDGVLDPADALVVVIEEDTARVGLLIDELVGRQQIVIKSLGDALRNVPGISGGAIMPSGSVGLVLDVAGLVRLAGGQEPHEPDGLN